MQNYKRLLLIILGVMYGVVFIYREIKKESPATSIPKPFSVAEKIAARKQWEATPAGLMFKKWEASPEGKKVTAGAAKLRAYIGNNANIEGVVTSLSLPAGSRLGYGVMVRIQDADYILAFGIDQKNEFEQLHSLKVNDKIIIRSGDVSKAPKYSYPIVAGDYVERDRKVLYKREPHVGGC